MRIRNDTDRPIIVALRDVEGCDDREELVQPGHLSAEFYNITDEQFEIEEPKEAQYVHL